MDKDIQAAAAAKVAWAGRGGVQAAQAHDPEQAGPAGRQLQPAVAVPLAAALAGAHGAGQAHLHQQTTSKHDHACLQQAFAICSACFFTARAQQQPLQ